MKARKVQGEMANVKINDFSQEIESIKILMSNYDSSDIFNMDETGLYYRSVPIRSNSKAPIKGNKKLLSRITLVFCVSLTGEKLPPFMIGTAIKPRSFNSFNFQDYIEYGSSRNGWMTSTLYKSWITKLNQKMTKQNRKILLLVDNCPSPTQIPLSNVKIVFLPPNTTGLLQPLDLGVIRSFKCFLENSKCSKC